MTRFSTTICPVLVGRATQLSLLTRLAAEAVSAHGRVALISGPAGIGKSRLLSEFRHALNISRNESDEATPPTVWEAHCYDTDQEAPYAPVADLLSSPAFESSGALASVRDAAPFLSDLVPGFGRPSPEALRADPAAMRRQFQHAFWQLAQRTANAGAGLVFIVEDIHWCDEATLALLLFIVRRITAGRMCLVLTFRSDETMPALEELLAGLERERVAAEFPLGPLTLHEVDLMVRTILRQSQSIPADVLELIFGLSGGNPFFIEEILKTTVGEGQPAARALEALSESTIRIPHTIQVAVQRRIAQLDGAAQRALQAGAVLGQRFDVSLLSALLAVPEPELLPRLKALVAVQICVELSADLLAFRHALTRQAVYNGLQARERQALHLRAAGTLESLGRAEDSRQVAALADHYYRAGLWEKVAEYAPLAAAYARSSEMPRSVAEYCTWSIEAAEQNGQPIPVDRLLERGHAFDTLGRFEAALADFQHALDIAVQRGDGRLEWRCLLEIGFQYTGSDYGQAGRYLQRALELSRRLGDHALLADTLNRVGNWNMMRDRVSMGITLHADALDLFQQSRNMAGMASTHDLLGVAGFIRGDMAEGAAHYERSISLFRDLNDRMGLSSSLATYSVRGLNYICFTTAYPATPEADFLHDVTEAIRIARQINWRAGEACGLMYRAMGLAPRGRCAAALEAGEACLAIATEIEHRVWTASAHMVLGMTYLDMLALKQARQHLETALALAWQIGAGFIINSLVGQNAMCALFGGDPARAAQILASTAALDLGQIPPGPDALQSQGQYTAWWAKAELELDQGRPDLALTIADCVIAALPDFEGEPPIYPRWEDIRGRALVALGRFDEGVLHLQAAGAAAETLEIRPLLWRIQIALGRAHQNAGQRKQAVTAFEAARQAIADVAAEMPATLRGAFIEYATSELPQPTPPTPRQMFKDRFDGLSPRECEVAAQVAAGRTNAQIAEALVLSERTVEKHTENILSKLGFRSRAQIAAWATAKGLHPSFPA